MRFLIPLFVFCSSVFADLGVTIYKPGNGPDVKMAGVNCVYLCFLLNGFTGTIGTRTFSASSLTIDPIISGFQSGTGQRLSGVPYIKTGGNLWITEVK